MAKKLQGLSLNTIVCTFNLSEQIVSYISYVQCCVRNMSMPFQPNDCSLNALQDYSEVMGGKYGDGKAPMILLRSVDLPEVGFTATVEL